MNKNLLKLRQVEKKTVAEKDSGDGAQGKGDGAQEEEGEASEEEEEDKDGSIFEPR